MDKIEYALEHVDKADSKSLLSLKIDRIPVPPLDELSVFDPEGRVIDWEGFPKELKRVPFAIFPGARLESIRPFEVEIDFELGTAFLQNLLTYLHKQVNKRIELLQTKLNGYQNNI